MCLVDLVVLFNYIMNPRRNFLYSVFMYFIPATRCFSLKRFLLRFCGARVGINTRVVSSAKFFISGNLNIGENCWVGHEVLIVGGNADVSIGDNCDIAPRVVLATGTHVIDATGGRIAGEGFSLPITIGNGAWVCAGATILGGSSIGEKSIVAAGAVVHGVFPPRCLIGGVPARVIRDL